MDILKFNQISGQFKYFLSFQNNGTMNNFIYLPFCTCSSTVIQCTFRSENARSKVSTLAILINIDKLAFIELAEFLFLSEMY